MFARCHPGLAAACWLMASLAGCHLVGGVDDFSYGDDGSGGGACDPASCPGSDEDCRTRSCDGGTCGFVDVSAATPCSELPGGVCDGFGACVECVDTAQCGAEEECEENLCVPLAANPAGAPCTVGSECQSGHCAPDDGVCCDSACDGTCQSCLAAKTGDSDGVCAPVDPALGPDPDDECSDEGPASCGAAGLGCSGTEAGCVLYPAETPCAPAGCIGSTFSSAGSCDGSGDCIPSAEESCAPYQCNDTGTACLTACTGELDCTAQSYCNVTGNCVAKKSNGAACNDPKECLDGHCVDGICCNTPCNNKCVACTAAKTGGSDGLCAVIPAGQDPDAECPGVETCDGAGACLCAGAGSDKPLGACCQSGGECASGNCADGVCCDAPCGGTCEACVGAKTSVGDGACAAVVVGTDPDDECVGAAACDATQMCSTCGVSGAPSGGACPSQCTGGCINGGTTCVVDCLGFSACKGGQVTCPSGFDCLVRCGDQGCKDATVTCPPSEACGVSCEGFQGCRNAQIQCGAGTCETSCGVANLVCDGTLVSCGSNECVANCVGASMPTLSCGTSCSCQGC